MASDTRHQLAVNNQRAHPPTLRASAPRRQMDVRASVQSALNAAARLVFSLQKYDSVTLLLQELHWLKVERRIEYKLAVLVYRCLHGTAPPYLANDFRRVADLGTRRRLRSASTPALVVPPSRLSTVGDRAFPVAAVNNQRPPTQRALPAVRWMCACVLQIAR